uniref:GGDEF domain-containing protein n=1 Tax=Angiostrongylus cantonensis TaxID=6313 RepID=A0A0K0DKL4_ANGCA
MIILSNLIIRLVQFNEVQWNWQLLFLASDSLAVVSLVYGLVREQPAFLQPFTIISIVMVSFCVLLSAFYLSAAIDPQSFAGEQIEILIAGQMKTMSEHFNITTRTGRRLS